MSKRELQQELAIWIIRLHCEDAHEREQAEREFLQWQQQHPESQQLIDKMQSLSKHLRQLSAKHRLSSDLLHQSFVLIEDSAQKVSKIFKHCILALGLLSTALLLYHAMPWSYYLADYSAEDTQSQPLQLSDGSKIQLGAESAINLDFNDQQRHIELVKGSIMVDVAKDPKRPFVVKSKYADFQTLGTQFIVYQDEQSSSLDMLQSKVQVRATQVDRPTAPVVVKTGESVSIDESGIGAIQKVDQALLKQSWPQDLIIANNMPLSTLLERLQRYDDGYLIFDEAQLEKIKVNGLIDAKQDILQTLALIQAKQPQLKVTAMGSMLVYVRTKH